MSSPEGDAHSYEADKRAVMMGGSGLFSQKHGVGQEKVGEIASRTRET